MVDFTIAKLKQIQSFISDIKGRANALEKMVDELIEERREEYLNDGKQKKVDDNFENSS